VKGIVPAAQKLNSSFSRRAYDEVFDDDGMQQQVVDDTGKPGVDDQILFLQSETAAYRGRFARAQDFTRRAADSAERLDEREAAAEYLSHDAVREALAGNSELAKRQAQAALGLDRSRLADAFSGVAFAVSGESAQAERLTCSRRWRLPICRNVSPDRGCPGSKTPLQTNQSPRPCGVPVRHRRSSSEDSEDSRGGSCK
jgi:hypothetical protein